MQIQIQTTFIFKQTILKCNAQAKFKYNILHIKTSMIKPTPSNQHQSWIWPHILRIKSIQKCDQIPCSKKFDEINSVLSLKFATYVYEEFEIYGGGFLASFHEISHRANNLTRYKEQIIKNKKTKRWSSYCWHFCLLACFHISKDYSNLLSW